MFSGSNLTTLRVKLLQSLDYYNPNDTTGVNSAGQLADLSLNMGLQTIYTILQNSMFLEAGGTGTLTSIANQSYIELANIGDLDIISGVRDLTNQISLVEITKERYFREVPNPTQNTGTPFRFFRMADRLWLDPMPTSAITYAINYVRSYPDLVNDADVALLPTSFDPWIIKEAKVEWATMQDMDSVPAILTKERDEAREMFAAKAIAGKNNNLQGGSYFRNSWAPRVNPYNHIA